MRYSQDVDLVPTDIGAGLILLHHDQEMKEADLTDVVSEAVSSTSADVNSEGQPQDVTDNLPATHSTDRLEETARAATPVPGAERLVSLQSLIPVSSPFERPCPPRQSWMNISLMTHYMKFSMASYGWPLYVFSNLMTGVCKLYPYCR